MQQDDYTKTACLDHSANGESTTLFRRTRLEDFSVLRNDGQGSLVLSEHGRQRVFRAIPCNASRLRLNKKKRKKRPEMATGKRDGARGKYETADSYISAV